MMVVRKKEVFCTEALSRALHTSINWQVLLIQSLSIPLRSFEEGTTTADKARAENVGSGVGVMLEETKVMIVVVRVMCGLRLKINGRSKREGEGRLEA